MIESPAVAWATIGLLLCMFELFVPGVYLIWFGFAAFAVSGYVHFYAPEITEQLIAFAITSSIFVTCGLYVYHKIFKSAKPDSKYDNLNNPAQQYVGNTVTLTEDVVDNRTKVKVGDTFWIAETEKALKKGDKAKITGVKDGLILLIK